MKEDNGVICAAPWVHLYIHPDGQVNPCCTAQSINYGNTNEMSVQDAWRSDTASNFRQDLLDGKLQDACKFCYNQEKFGNGNSLRTRLNNDYGELITDNTKPDFALRYLDIRSSNMCNMACVMCGHALSSSWYEDGSALKYQVKEGASKFITLSNNTEQDILTIIDNKLEVIYFAGGEPLMTPYHYTLLNEVVRRGLAPNIKLEYNTNLSTLKYKKIDILDLWKQFKWVSIRASIDAVDDIGEYQRYGSNWEKIVKNWHTIKSEMPEVHVLPQITITNLSIRNIPKFLDYLVNQMHVDPFHWREPKGSQQFTYNMAVEPQRFSSVNLPKPIKDMYTVELSEYRDNLDIADERRNVVDACLEHMNSADPDLWHFRNGLKFLSKLDIRRNNSWKKLWPEFMEYDIDKN